MLTFLEIALTIRAFRAGWRFLALLPLGLGLPLAFLLGASAHGNVKELMPVLIGIDVIVVVILAVMGSNPPVPARRKEPTWNPATH